MKTTPLLTTGLLVVVCFFQLGCEPPEIPTVDAETQKELDELTLKLDQKISRNVSPGINGFQASDSFDSAPPQNPEGQDSNPQQTQQVPVIVSQESPPNPVEQTTNETVNETTEDIVVNSDNEIELSDGETLFERAREAKLSESSSPEEVCETFLQALRQGDSLTASQLLTNLAQIQTTKAKLQLESPGGPDAKFDLQGARYATGERKVCQVTTFVRQPGVDEPVVLNWMMRFQYNGWKISGMSVQFAPNEPPDLLSFENPKDLDRIKQSVDEEPTQTSNADIPNDLQAPSLQSAQQTGEQIDRR